MRFSIVILICSTLFACGKTGALYLPEEEPETAPPQQQTPAPVDEDSGKTN